MKGRGVQPNKGACRKIAATLKKRGWPKKPPLKKGKISLEQQGVLCINNGKEGPEEKGIATR